MKDMFCFQCQQTAHNKACEGKAGVCGKKADTANYQDELVGALIGLARAAKSGNPTAHTDELVMKGLFTTLTNVNFNNVTIKQIKTEIETEKGRINSEKFEDYGMENIWDDHEDTVTTGFAHNTVLSNADKIVDLVKQGKIKHFFLIGGCDGASYSRSYYTDFAKLTPPDTIILTLACGKYRINDLDLGYIEGIPRILDCGQCNDAYSAIKIALALADAFNCTVNDLPLTLVLSWYEQKAVCILLTLLYLGIKNIYLGPTLPAFVSKGVLDILIEKFNLTPIDKPQEDYVRIMNK